MSDSDDELLQLAGVSEGEEGSEQGSPPADDDYEPAISTTARRGSKRHIEEEEEDDMEVEERAEEDPYPLEGKFKNEDDREKLMAMDEVTREQILYDRMQEKERLTERRFLALRARQNTIESSTMEKTGSKSKRLKTSKLSELKRQREKSKRKSSKRDGDYDDDEDLDDLADDDDDRDLDELAGYGEGGDNDAYYSDEYEPSEGKKKTGKSASAGASWGTSGYDDKFHQDATFKDFNGKVRSSRSVLNRFMYREEFVDVVPGSYVRVSIGLSKETRRPQYRMARIEEVKRDGKPYKLNGKACNTYLLVSQGEAKKVIDIACISDSSFTEEEFKIYRTRLENSGMEMPSLGEVEEKFTELRNMSAKKLTDRDINKMVARRQELAGAMDSASRVIKLTGLREELQAAMERMEVDKVKELNRQIDELTKMKGKTGASNQMSRINLRNKKSTEALIRQAEARKAQVAKQQQESVTVEEDPNDPFSKLALEDDLPHTAPTAEVANCRYRREGIEAVIKDIPLEIELHI